MEERTLEQLPFRLHSPAFAYGTMIPSKYTDDGLNVNPPLSIVNVPEDAVALALLMEDPDAPGGVWVHWRLWDINPRTTLIKERSTPKGAVVGINSFGEAKYGGPAPSEGEHAYTFHLYALRRPLQLPKDATDLMFRNALLGNLITETDLVGYYSRRRS